MTQCPNCGADVGEQEAVCWNCNVSLEGGAAQGGQGQPTNQQGQPPQGQQGQPPQGGRQQGQPPQGGHQQGQPPQGQQGQPPQGGYQQGGQPPQGQPPQGQYGQPPQDDSGIGRRELIAGGGVLAAAGAGGWFFFLRDGGSGGPGSPENPGASYEEAPSVSEGTHGPYEISQGEEHYFAVDLEQGEQLSVTMEFQHSEADLDMRIDGPNESGRNWAGSTTDNETLSHTASQAGTFYIVPYHYSGSTNDYELDVSIESGSSS